MTFFNLNFVDLTVCSSADELLTQTRQRAEPSRASVLDFCRSCRMIGHQLIWALWNLLPLCPKSRVQCSSSKGRLSSSSVAFCELPLSKWYSKFWKSSRLICMLMSVAIIRCNGRTSSPRRAANGAACTAMIGHPRFTCAATYKDSTLSRSDLMTSLATLRGAKRFNGSPSTHSSLDSSFWPS